MAKARTLQQQSIEMIGLLGKYGGIATGKAFMKSISIDCGGFRLPVKNMSKLDFEAFSEDLSRMGFDQFCSK
jgi:N-acetylneuraminate lyase